MPKDMSSLCSFEVGTALIPVQMAMSAGVVLERLLTELADDMEPLLCSFLRLHLILLDMSTSKSLRLHSPRQSREWSHLILKHQHRSLLTAQGR